MIKLLNGGGIVTGLADYRSRAAVFSGFQQQYFLQDTKCGPYPPNAINFSSDEQPKVTHHIKCPQRSTEWWVLAHFFLLAIVPIGLTS